MDTSSGKGGPSFGWLLWDTKPASGNPQDEGPSSGGPMIDLGSASLREDSVLFKEFADSCTPESLRSFLEKYPGLGGKPKSLLSLRPGLGLFATPLGAVPSESERTDEDKVVYEALVLRRCNELWDMVCSRDHRYRLGKHIGPISSGDTPLYMYDSHPDLDPRVPAPWPDRRERVRLRVPQVPKGDFRPVACDYLRRVITAKLYGQLNVRVTTVPDTQRGSRLQIVPSTILAALWLQFAEHVAGERPTTKCIICGTWFRPLKHIDQIYCKPACKVKACRLRKTARKLKREKVSDKMIAAQLHITLDLVRTLNKKEDKSDD